MATVIKNCLREYAGFKMALPSIQLHKRLKKHTTLWPSLLKGVSKTWLINKMITLIKIGGRLNLTYLSLAMEGQLTWLSAT
jgi:hypothetical protein